MANRLAMPLLLRLASVLVVFGPSLAYADAIEPPPTDCPVGSEGDSSHCGAGCRPRGCVSVGDCRIGETCAARDLCIRSTPCGGDVESACGSAPCASGVMCTSVFVCAPGTTPADAGRRDAGGPPAIDSGTPPGTDAGSGERYTTSYCGCAVPRHAPVPRWTLAVSAALLVVVLGRRR